MFKFVVAVFSMAVASAMQVSQEPSAAPEPISAAEVGAQYAGRFKENGTPCADRKDKTACETKPSGWFTEAQCFWEKDSSKSFLKPDKKQCGAVKDMQECW